MTSPACPAQWEGELNDGRMLYIRFRWVCLEIRVSPEPTDNIMEAVNGNVIYNKSISDAYDGSIKLSKVAKILESKGIGFSYKVLNGDVELDYG